MAVDKLVDSAQLNTDLTAVANAIRAKSGSSTPLAFPGGFVSEIGSIQTGGGEWTTDGIISGAEPNGDIVYSGTTFIRDYAFAATSITRFSAPNLNLGTAFAVGEGAFRNCKSLVSVSMPYVQKMYGTVFQGCTALTTVFLPAFAFERMNTFNGCTSLVTIDLPSCSRFFSYDFDGCTQLKTVILNRNKKPTGGLGAYSFRNSKLDTLVLNGPDTKIWSLGNVNAFYGTPFASGGTGGTIYIPEALYNELGTGSSLDYKAATNWSIVNGYGTITWAKIKGSIYE